MEILLNSKAMTYSGKVDFGSSEISLSGFENILLDMNIWDENLNSSELIEKNLRTAFSVCQKNNLKISAVRTLSISENVSKKNPDERDIKAVIETIKMCGKLNCKYVVVPPVSNTADLKITYNTNKEFYLNIGKTAIENDVIILVENTCCNFNGHYMRGYCCDSDMAVEFIDELNSVSDRFGLCCDTGALKLCGIDMEEYILKAGDHIKMVRICENDGNENSSSMICGNNKEWQRAVSGLRKINFDGLLLFDVDDVYLSFPQIFRSKLLEFIREISEYYKWVITYEKILKKYSDIVIFGAKNMLDYYMMDYGKKYPPLFVCDNNKELWGKKCRGLTICPPEKLYDVPENCGIIICSVYYREIKKQLSDMGLKNIEYFYDEC